MKPARDVPAESDCLGDPKAEDFGDDDCDHCALRRLGERSADEPPAEAPRPRVRYLGPGPQWGDGGEFHGWEVVQQPAVRPGAGWWRPPRTEDERRLVRAAMRLGRDMFSGPIGAEVPAAEETT